MPILQKTQLGWVVSGNAASSNSTALCHFASSNGSPEMLDDLLQKFWEIEEIEDIKQDSSNSKCEEHFNQTVSRDEAGRFVVRLPFSLPSSSLGDSSFMAEKRFLNFEKRLARDSNLRVMYSNFMKEYMDLGHMELVDIPKTPNYYLPHHCVFKPDSTSTKLRVVFDASSKTSSGVSLNDIMMTGPVVQNELFIILLRFRAPCFVVSADITKMYRQIVVHPEDRQFQYIFWRFNNDEPIKTYQLNTVTYGTTPAPFLSTRCLKQLSIDYATSHPIASAAIAQDIYVDDLLTGTNSVEDTKKLKSDITKLLSSSGMTLLKRCSNNSSILSDVAEEDKEQVHRFHDDQFITTLGLYWHALHDSFRIKINLPESPPKFTKRVIMSEVAKIYDPVGLISPVVVIGKLIMQQLWSLKINWDESIPLHIHTSWTSFRDELQCLQHIFIPRHLFNGDRNPTRIQIHGFADASEKAFGAVLYIRFQSSDSFVTRLFASKSRIAPVKKITLPRLELCAALLLVTLVQKIRPAITFEVDDYCFWTDSTIVLHWLNSPSSRWNTFVANRVSKIQSATNSSNWRHVRSEYNPADLISRGKLPTQLIDCEMWWRGPPFLQRDDSEWYKPFITSGSIDLVPEQRKICQSSLSSTVKTIDDSLLSRLKHTNSLISMQNTVCYMLRFIHNTKPGVERISGSIMASEARRGLYTLIQFLQRDAFPDVYFGNQNPKYRLKNSTLKSLSLFMSEDNIIRVGGGLDFSSISNQS